MNDSEITTLEIGLYEIPDDQFVRGYKIPDVVCDDIIKYFNNSKHLQSNVRRVNKSDSEVVLSKIKFSTDITVMPETFNKEQSVSNYMQYLDQCIIEYINKFDSLQGSTLGFKNGWNIQWYKPNEGYFAPHFERSNNIHTVDRVLVFMTYLNDVEDGGTEFIYQGITLKAKKGNTWIWPADFTHTHVGQICSSNKYIATGWIEYLGRDYSDFTSQNLDEEIKDE